MALPGNRSYIFSILIDGLLHKPELPPSLVYVKQIRLDFKWRYALMANRRGTVQRNFPLLRLPPRRL